MIVEFTHEQIAADQPDKEIEDLLGAIPGRWGRMSFLSRLVLVEAAAVLQKDGLLQSGERLPDNGLTGGLIGATSRGSLFTDQAFMKTMENGPGLASPALFGYTLPNIPLAEAAVALGLTGPVYALFEEVKPLECACEEAQRFLNTQSELDFMLACEFDHYVSSQQEDEFTITLTVVR